MVKRIICVDDDPVCLMLEKMVITHAKITDEVHLTHSVESALELLNTFQLLDNKETVTEAPTLVFLDLNMPVKDGFDFLDALNAFGARLSNNLKVVIVSSSIDAREISRSKAYKSVIEFISKPLTVNAVRSISFQ